MTLFGSPLKKSLSTAITKLVFFLALTLSVVILSFTGAYAKTTLFNNAEIHYELHGKGGKNIVLIHGWACDSRYWKKQIEALASENSVLVIDLPGHGKSATPEVSYSLQYFSDAVIAVMDAENINHAVLVGHSMGSSVGKTVAQTTPDRVEGFFSVDGALYLLEEQDEQHAFDDLLASLKGEDGEKVTEKFIRSMFTQAADTALIDWVVQEMLATKQSVRLSAMESLCDINSWQLKPVAVPTYVLFAYDFTNPHTPTLQDIRQQFPGVVEYSVISGVGHFIMMEQPELMNERILGFVSSLP